MEMLLSVASSGAVRRQLTRSAARRAMARAPSTQSRRGARPICHSGGETTFVPNRLVADAVVAGALPHCRDDNDSGPRRGPPSTISTQSVHARPLLVAL